MKFLLSIFFLLACGALYGQSFLDMKDKKGHSLYEDNWFNWLARYTYVSGKNNEKYGGFTGNVSIRSAKAGKGEISVNYENVTLGDYIWMLANLKKSQKLDQAFGAGFLGWVQGYYNVVATDKLIVAPGASFGDYIFGSEFPTEISPSVLSNEPFGYYFAVGPSVKVSYLLNDSFWVDGILTADIPFAKVNKGSGANVYHQDGYPHPWFVNVTGTLYHKSKLFFSVRVNQAIDRGGNDGSASRLDVSLGYQMLH
ncbi:MAG: hypothetical protein RI909_186 [Bacteroidota bacterium]|jgi:hypothetical protein